MQKRVFNVLLVASRYDAFIMEEDGRVEEQIYFEYVSLNLSSPPRVKQVTTNEEAFEELALKRYDLIITMPGVDCSETFTQAKAMKRLYPYIPIVVQGLGRKYLGLLQHKIIQIRQNGRIEPDRVFYQ